MYIGRIVAFGMTKENKVCAMYRVSSRSFPNRQAVENNGKIAIVPRAGAESDLAKNPYISYNCLRIAGEWAIATNGSQTDPITEKIAMGMPVRDAIALGLLAMDYEKDSRDTPGWWRLPAESPKWVSCVLSAKMRCWFENLLLSRELPVTSPLMRKMFPATTT